MDTLAAPRFSAYGWVGDTLWGIERGRLAFAQVRVTSGRASTTGVQRQDNVVWGVSVGTRARVVTWTNEQGLFARNGAGVRHLLRPDDAPGPDYLGPEIAWGSSRALLTWTAEAGPLLSVLDAEGAHSMVQARLPRGHHPGGPVIWLDERTAVVGTTSMVSSAGSTDYREIGFRANLALLDFDRDTLLLLTDVPDGTYLRPEGLLHADTLLVGVYVDANAPARHITYDTRSWTAQQRLNEPGRATPCGGHIVLLRPLSDAAAGGEPIWEAVLYDVSGRTHRLGQYAGYDVRVIWDADCGRVAVAHASETRGVATVVAVRALRSSQ